MCHLPTGETTASEASTPPAYPDPSRDVWAYMKWELGISPQSTNAEEVTAEFMALCSQQCRGNWFLEYTADVVNDYIRAGFGVVQNGGIPCE